jgi:DNA-directed RNA polymerase specialized sigma24 family protein
MNPLGDGVRIEPFERLYDAYYRDIAAYVIRRAAAQDVEDVVAKVFAVAWRRFERIPAPPDDRLWLFGVARHCLNDLRQGTTAPASHTSDTRTPRCLDRV